MTEERPVTEALKSFPVAHRHPLRLRNGRAFRGDRWWRIATSLRAWWCLGSLRAPCWPVKPQPHLRPGVSLLFLWRRQSAHSRTGR